MGILSYIHTSTHHITSFDPYSPADPYSPVARRASNGQWSSGKYSTDYEDKDGKELNQPTLSPKSEEEPAEDDGEPAKDDGEPTNNEEEAP